MTLHVGVEVPCADLAAWLSDRLGELPGLLDASGASYVVIGADRAEEGALLLLRRTQYLAIHAADDLMRARTFVLARRIATLMDGLPLALDQAGQEPGEPEASA